MTKEVLQRMRGLGGQECFWFLVRARHGLCIVLSTPCIQCMCHLLGQQGASSACFFLLALIRLGLLKPFPPLRELRRVLSSSRGVRPRSQRHAPMVCQPVLSRVFIFSIRPLLPASASRDMSSVSLYCTRRLPPTSALDLPGRQHVEPLPLRVFFLLRAGMNQPVIDLRTTRCYITPQNHGFAVDESTVETR